VGDLSEAVRIGVQLGASTILALLMTIIHGGGLIGISRILHLNTDRLENREFNLGAYVLMGMVGTLVFALHVLEIAVFAGFYMLVGALDGAELAFYYSAAAYATLGRTIEDFPSDWRLLGSLEALIGFLLIGWSTAFMVSTTNKLRR
jgi:hypothetical protein